MPVTVNGQTTMRTSTTRHVSWEPVEGRVSHTFDDVQVSAATRPNPVDLAGFAPWDLDRSVPHTLEEVAGHEVVAANLTDGEGLSAAKVAMAGVLEQRCARDIDGAHQRVDRVDSRFGDITRRTVLVPVWRTTVEYDGRR